MKKSIGFLALMCLALAINGVAQVRPVETAEDEKKETKDKAGDKVEVKSESPENLPSSFKVKYEGGLFGFNEKQHGTIKLDYINERLVFFGKDKKEKFSIPYKAMLVVSPSNKKVRAGSGRVVGAAPLPGAGLLGSLIKKRKNYLVIRFQDTDVDAQGTINFLLDTRVLTASAINSIGKQAKMKQRGDSYLRGKHY